MAVGISIKPEISSDLRRTINRSIRFVEDMRPVLKQMGLLVATKAQSNIMVGGRPKWPGLKLATLLERGSTVGGRGLAKPLRDTGLLMASIVSPQSDSHGIWDLRKASLKIGTNVPYATYQQDGTKTIPARPFLGVDDIDENKMLRLLSDFMDKAMKS